MKILRLQCPNLECKRVVSVQYVPGMEEKIVKCPFCGRQSYLKDWGDNEQKKIDERKRREEEAQRRKEEEAQRRRETEARRQSEIEAQRQRDREALRIKDEEIQRQREQEAQRLREQEAQRLREQEAQRLREQEAQRLREQEAQRLREQEAQRLREQEAQRQREINLQQQQAEERIRMQEEQNRSALGVGRLVSMNTGATYNLSPGRNVVGRMAQTSTADIQIPDTTGSKRMSRSHFVINVLKENGQYVHYASLIRPDVNATFVNNMQLIYGQQVRLFSMDVIYLPDESLQFQVDSGNPDETQIFY